MVAMMDPADSLSAQERSDFELNRRHRTLPWIGHRLAFALTRGRLGSTRRGIPVGLLTTTGRRTGQRRTIPIMYLREGKRVLLAAANSGYDAPPAWYLNLLADPVATFRTRDGESAMVARDLTGEERDAAFARVVSLNPLVGAYQRCTSRQIAVVALEPPGSLPRGSA